MANLKIEHLDKIYPNKFQAVYDFNLEINDQDFVVFVGPSGCGKSTTLRMIAGLEDVTSGKIYIDGELVNFIEPKDRNIAMVFQSYALYPNMNVFDNLAFGLKMRKKMIPVLDETDPNYPTYVSLKEEIVSLKEKMRKDKRQNEDVSSLGKEIFEKEIELYNLQERIKKVKEIDQRKVKEITSEINSANKSIAKYKADIEKIKAEIEKFSSRIEIEKNEKKIAKTKENIETLKQGISLYEKKIEATESLLALDQKKLDFYANTPLEKYKYQRHSKDEITRKIHEVSKILGIDEYLARKPSTLSGGQRQRVAIGRAIVRNPKVFLMDEPLSNLDAKLRVQMRQEIIRIHREIGATTIYVTHDQQEAMTMANKIVVMKDGHMMQVGTPQEVFKHPLNKFVAGFIGTPQMNFIEAKVNGDVLSFDDKTYVLDENQKRILSSYQGKDIIFGVRPDSIELKDDGAYEAKVDMVELVGCDKIVYLDMNHRKMILKVKNYVSVKQGSVIRFDFCSDKVYFFDKDSEIALY